MKKYLISIFTIVFCFICIFAYAAEGESIDVLYHGESVEFDAEPYYLNGRIMVPIRAIFEALGAVVDWNETTNTADAVLGDTRVSLAMGSDIIIINGNECRMDASTELAGDRLFAPARFVAESFGKSISYHEASQTAIISDSKEYTYYDGITRPVPRVEWIDGATLESVQTGEYGEKIYKYSGDENTLTEYINFLQLDFGYYIYNMEYLDDGVVYTYISDKLKLKITEKTKTNGMYTIELIPDIDLMYQISEAEEVVSADKPLDAAMVYDDVDYASVTGARFIESHTDDGVEFFVYEYSPFDVAMYESFIESQGWVFYDFSMDIDTFSNLNYWKKGDSVLCVSVNHFYGIVMVAIL